MINFVDLVPGNRFLKGGKEYMKLASEVYWFANPGAGYNLRMNIETEDGDSLVGRVAIIYNAVDVNSAELISLQSEDLVEVAEKDFSEKEDSGEESYTF